MSINDGLEAVQDQPKPREAITLRGWVGIFVAAFLVVGALLAWDALTPNRRTTEDIESSITADLKSQGLAQGEVKVNCPKLVEDTVGGTFDCAVSGAGGPTKVTVTLGENPGTFTWVAG